MDVRCEKCQTEYELDESKLKPGGVTVKCTQCGHMFKVRRGRTTNVGPAADTDYDDEPTRPRSPTPAMGTAPTDESERTWLVRLDDGEIKTCQELVTLQKWIVAGEVTRSCEISRTGKKWKKLGEIGELISFFQIADEARDVAATGLPNRLPRAHGSSPSQPESRPLTHPRTIRRSPTSVPPAPPGAAGRPAAIGSSAGAGTVEVAEPETKKLRPLSPRPPGASEKATSPSALADIVEADADRKTGAWAVQGKIEGEAGADPVGPTGGMARGVPTDDVAFAAKNIHIKGEFENGAFVATENDDDDFMPPKSGLGKWVVLFSLLVMAGAGIAVYFVVFEEKDQSSSTVAAEVADAAPEQAAPADSAPPEEPMDGEQLAAAAAKEMMSDTVAGLELVADKLARSETKEPAVLIARALVETALSQHILDEAAVAATPAEQKKLHARAKQRADAALALASESLKSEPDNVHALVAKANALRLQGKSSREVQRELRKALRIDKENREALLSRGLLFVRDNRLREARNVFAALGGDGGVKDVRPRYRLALLDFADEAYEQARAGVDAVLSIEPEHAGASALRERIEKATAVVATDPMPPEDGDDGDDGDNGSGGGIDTYDRLLDKADRLAVNGNCTEAMSWYNKALSVQPSGVAALTGLGYCHLDKKQFASAQAKFRAALGISSRYQDALWGVAEGYQQQGLEKQAIAAYKKFIAAHPGSVRATSAKRQIARLGGSVGDGDTGDGTDSGGGDTGGGDTGGDDTGGGDTGGGDTGGGDTGGDNGGGTDTGDGSDTGGGPDTGGGGTETGSDTDTENDGENLE